MKKKRKIDIKLIIAFAFGLIITLVIGYSTTYEFEASYTLYNNTNTGMASTNVNDAIDELNSTCNTRLSECPDGKKCFDDPFHEQFGDAYLKLKNISSTGDQYIDTGVVPDRNTGYFVDFSTNTVDTTDLTIFGETSGTNASKVWFDHKYNSSTPSMEVYANMGTQTTSKVDIGTSRTHVYYNYLDSGWLEINHTRTDITSGKTSMTGASKNLYLFAYNNNGTVAYKSKITLVEFIITDGSEIIKKFTPCMRRSDNKAGLCEEIDGLFYPSLTNEFIAGPIADDRGDETYKVGDYIQMNSSYNCPGNSKTAISLNNLTGYNGTAQLCSSTAKTNLNLYRVIKVNDDYSVDAVSEYTTNTIPFRGSVAYQNYIETLNYLSGYFNNPTYSHGIRSMGYTGDVQTPKLSINNAWYPTQSPQPYSTSIDRYPYNGSCLTEETGWTGNFFEEMNRIQQMSFEQQGIGDIGYQTDEDLVSDLYGDLGAYKHGTSTVTHYALASRAYERGVVFTGDNVCSYGIMRADYSHGYEPLILVEINFFGSPQYNNSRNIMTYASNSYTNLAIRPVITLYSYTIPFSGSGTQADPYIMNRPS